MMNSKILFTIGAFFLYLVVSPLKVSAQTTQRFTATLTGAKEIPSNQSSGTGTAILDINTSTSNPTWATLTLTFSGLSSSQTAAHFHGPAGSTATAAPFWTIPNGQQTNYSLHFTSAELANIQNGQVYINIHTQNYLDGEIRGQLQLTPTGSTPSPSPSVIPSPTPVVTMTPSNNMCRSDINSDQVIDISDYSILVANFLQSSISNPRADINQDNVVDISDYSILVAYFLQTVTNCTSSTPGPTSTPTPTPITQTPGESLAMSAWGPSGKNIPNPQYDKCDDGTNVVAAHNAYYVIAYDGIKYPTWHPPVVNNPITGVGKCYFGHEHGTNPQNYLFWNEMIQHFGKDLNNNGTIEPLVINPTTGAITPGDRAGIPFGIANEHMDQYYNQENRDSVFVRHEDHVGHKIEIVNNEAEMNVPGQTNPMAQLSGTQGVNVPYYGSSTGGSYAPTGVSCAHLHKFHQGTHSGDAILNNLHEVTFHSKCQSVNVNSINAPAYYPDNTVILTGMMAFGRPGIYKEFCGRKRDDNICGLTGANFGTSVSSTELASCQLTDPLLSKLPNAINSNSLGRNMTDRYCLEHIEDPGYGISEGSIYFTPYEIWEGDFAVYTGNTLTDSSMLAEHGRQWDVLDPVRIIDIGYQHPTRPWQKDYRFNSEECDGLLTKPGTNIRRTAPGTCDNGNRPWDSPQAGFKGLKRTTYFGRNRVSNPGGSQIYWTDPIGGNAVTTQFSSGLKQSISTVEADIQRVQSRVQQLFGSDHFLNDRALQRGFNSGGGTVHAPN